MKIQLALLFNMLFNKMILCSPGAFPGGPPLLALGLAQLHCSITGFFLLLLLAHYHPSGVWVLASTL